MMIKNSMTTRMVAVVVAAAVALCLLSASMTAEATMVGARRLRLSKQQQEEQQQEQAEVNNQQGKRITTSSIPQVDELEAVSEEAKQRDLQAEEASMSMSMSMSMSTSMSMSMSMPPVEEVSVDGTCVAEGEACEVLTGTCCGGLECVADIITQPVPSVSYSCQAPFEPRCNVCGDGLSVTVPDALPSLVIPELTFSCAEVELAGQLGVFPGTLCGFIPNFVADTCGCE